MWQSGPLAGTRTTPWQKLDYIPTGFLVGHIPVISDIVGMEDSIEVKATLTLAYGRLWHVEDYFCCLTGCIGQHRKCTLVSTWTRAVCKLELAYRLVLFAFGNKRKRVLPLGTETAFDNCGKGEGCSAGGM